MMGYLNIYHGDSTKDRVHLLHHGMQLPRTEFNSWMKGGRGGGGGGSLTENISRPRCSFTAVRETTAGLRQHVKTITPFPTFGRR
jgi:hypothetical protein